MRTWTRARWPLGLALALMLTLPSAAVAQPTFRPRINHAMGLVPIHGKADIASGVAIPLVFHGGVVMHPPVTVHTVFWAPAGYSFTGSPGTGLLGYQALVQRFFADVAHDSGSAANVFSILSQYGDPAGASGYGIQYAPAADAILDADPYPKLADQCASPAGDATCVTDTELGTELNALVSKDDPTAHGLHDIWFVFLPPNVDECISGGACGTTSFGAYHSVTDRGEGAIVYAAMPDPLIGLQLAAGSDPNGNLEGDAVIDYASHELIEGLTDPLGTGWMDPNGYEVGDKCEQAYGNPLGYANGSPYNNLINGHKYLIQAMYSNAGHGCVNSNSVVTGAPTLPSIYFRQFSSRVRGNIGVAKAGVAVQVTLMRAFDPVASASATTRADGSWGPVNAAGLARGVNAAFGDDRDAIAVEYGQGGPGPDLIGTGSGGNPFTEAGYTGWYDLDASVFAEDRGVAIAPCGQVGVLTVGGVSYTGSPEALCNGETDTAQLKTSGALTLRSHVTLTSLDNRASTIVNPGGALVGLTVPVGEPDSIGLAALPDSLLFIPGGLPTCAADLRAQTVSCQGLVPGNGYRLLRARGGLSVRGTAGEIGQLTFPQFKTPAGVAAFRGGDQLRLVNPAGRTLTTLHVAHLKVAITASQTTLAGGTCQAGAYYGKPVSAPPITSAGVGNGGATGTGTICPLNGRAKGLPDALIEQSDDLSGGLTRTEVPALTGEAPANDATVYGPFTALAQAGLTGPAGGTVGVGAPISVRITRSGSDTPVFTAANVNTPGGSQVSGLSAGVYSATWVVRDINGDTRTLVTRFVEA